MSPRSATGPAGGGGRVALSALLIVLVAVGMMLLVRARPGNEPFDPRSGDGDGTRGLVLLLERYGADVDVARSVPAADGERRVLVLQDRLDDEQRAALVRFAEAGGVVVVADPQSPLTAGVLGTTSFTNGGAPYGGTVEAEANVAVDECTVASLTHLRGLYVREGVEFGVPSSAPSCFGSASQAFAVVQSTGAGAVVALGDNRLFTNDFLRFADNSGLATALLAPREGGTVSILLGSGEAKTVADIGTGEQTLSDLVRPGVWMALVQLAVAFLVFAVARAVRPGRPVREPEQVPIAGSELAVATGNLMQRAHHAERAGWLLRANLHRELCRRCHLPSTTSIDALDAAAVNVAGLAPGRVAAALQREPTTDADLVQLSNELHAIRELAALPTTILPTTALPESTLQGAHP